MLSGSNQPNNTFDLFGFMKLNKSLSSLAEILEVRKELKESTEVYKMPLYLLICVIEYLFLNFQQSK